MRRSAAFAACLAGLAALAALPSPLAAQRADREAAAGPQSVVLVSIDGFRADYLDSFPLPNLRALAARGVRARWMQPATPTLTFPNHYTLVTGLYPAHHGIINNTIVDPADGARFVINDTAAVRNSRWWGGEPLWVTAERQGLHAASFFWPGSEAAIGGVRPTFYKPYRDTYPNADRVDTVLAWLTRTDSLRPRFVTLYFSAVDHESHGWGPWSAQARTAAVMVDSMVGRLADGLARLGLSDRVNLVVVADHGMAEISAERVVYLEDYLPVPSLVLVTLTPFLSARPRNGDVPSALAALRRVPHLRVFPRDSVPERWHYRGHPRIPAIIGVMDEGWELTIRSIAARRASRAIAGTHGFDNENPSMRAMFVAAGPAFRSGVVVEPFQNIHVYDLVCGILGLQPAPNDGSPDSTRAMRLQP